MAQAAYTAKKIPGTTAKVVTPPTSSAVRYVKKVPAATAKAVTPSSSSAVRELEERLIRVDIAHEWEDYEHPQIRSVEDLKNELGELSTMVFRSLGKQFGEAAYQRALEVHLKRCGVSVDMEVPISIMYMGEKISSRRLDLLLRLPDKSEVIVETKAVSTLTKGTSHAAQLEYYMDVFDVNHGFLINFPHEQGFPPPPSGAVFRQEVISGLQGPLSDRQLRGKYHDVPEISYFRRT